MSSKDDDMVMSDDDDVVASSSSSSSGLFATKKRTVFLSDDSFGPVLESGTDDIKWHRFSTTEFDSKEDYKEYASDTGLEKTNVYQDWGGSKPRRVRRSRRGSISGFEQLDDGRVAAWRWSSYATSRALDADDKGKDFMAAYDKTARDVSSKAKNTRGTEISPNAVLSDAGLVLFDEDDESFSLESTSYAQGLSAAGIDKRKSSAVKSLYAPTIDSAKAFGKKPSPSYSHHSEGMAVALHEQARGSSLEDTPGLNMMVTSFPNQVCANCGRMFQRKMGKSSHVSGMSGRDFGGQKPGEMTPVKVGDSTVYRSDTTTHLLTDPGNAEELSAIQHYHGNS